MEGHVAVRIKAHVQIAYGEELLVCGSAPQLGSWNLAEAALMTCEDKVWSLATFLPCGVRVELKLVQRPQGRAVIWHGAGAGGSANVQLETSLGRGGAQRSRFAGLEGFPWLLEVEDLGPEEAAGLLAKPDQPDVSAAQPQQPAQPGQPGPVGSTALAPVGYGGGNAGGSAAPTPVTMEALLAGHAAAAGHAVTYTTTTTTTTAVTINGATPSFPTSPTGPAIEYCPPHQQQQAAPPASNGVNGKSAPEQKALPPPEPTQEDMKAMVAARQLNAGIPRAGPLPLTWATESAQDVRVRGSWDGWKRDLALEPCPGVGFRAMLLLPAGEYEFKFIVDGVWTTSDEIEQTKCANKNNVATVNEMVLVPVPLTQSDKQQEAGSQLAIEAEADFI